MKIELVKNPDKQLADFFEEQIEAFNFARWEVKEKKLLAVVVKDNEEKILAGAAGKTFGLWLLLDNLWVSESCRGQNLGSVILALMEKTATERGCRYVLLETLNFQARPFYEKFGYVNVWTQKFYPREGCKYFMVKNI